MPGYKTGYKVRANDTWSKLAQAFNTTVPDLLAANPSVNSLKQGITVKTPSSNKPASSFGGQITPFGLSGPGTPDPNIGGSPSPVPSGPTPGVPGVPYAPTPPAPPGGGLVSPFPPAPASGLTPEPAAPPELGLPTFPLQPGNPYGGPYEQVSTPGPGGFIPRPTYGDVPYYMPQLGPYDDMFSGIAASATANGFTTAINQGIFPTYVYKAVQNQLGITDAEFQAAGYAKDQVGNWIRQDPTGPGNDAQAARAVRRATGASQYYNRGGGGYGGFPSYGGGGSYYSGGYNASYFSNNPTSLAGRGYTPESLGLITWRI